MINSITEEKLKNIKRKRLELKLEDVKGNFVPTEEAKERLQKIQNFFDSKIPVLLEGPTGTSKTKLFKYYAI